MSRTPSLPRRVTTPPPRRHSLDPKAIRRFVADLVGDDLHALQVLSLADGVTGVLNATSLAVHAIGEGLAAARGLEPKHAIKQFDRLLSNTGIDAATLSREWVRFVVAKRPEIVVAIDWTDFDDDDQTTIVLNLITRHGRAPLCSGRPWPKRPSRRSATTSRTSCCSNCAAPCPRRSP